MELANKRNSVPLPSISNEYGVRLPPPQFQLLNYDMIRYDEVWSNIQPDGGRSYVFAIKDERRKQCSE